LDPHYYQCSRRTTSAEIETVFHHAIRCHEQSPMQNCGKEISLLCIYTQFCCINDIYFSQLSYILLFMVIVVFMDEAGLPEERHESLKVILNIKL